MSPRTFHDETASPAMARSTRCWSITAKIMLAVLVMTVALSGSLRDCFGQNGHHAIEWAHSKNINHLSQYTQTFHDWSAGRSALHSGRSCVDHLIFAKTLRPTSSIGTFKPLRPRHIPFADLAWEHSWRTGLFEPRISSRPFARKTSRDPALIALRTIVLLN
jgi:hypothetical protein